MKAFMRFVDRALREGFFLGLALVFVFCAGFAFHPAIGFAALALFGLGMIVRAIRNRRRDWAPDVCGQNAYQILGVGRNANLPTIRLAFRELERKHHPDAARPEQKREASVHFNRITQAYELLSNVDWRYEYDGLIDSEDGRIPPFEEAYLLIRGEKNPLYEQYDSLFPEERKPGPPPVAPPSESVSPGSEPIAVEVEIPDSIREAMGLPPKDPLGGK